MKINSIFRAGIIGLTMFAPSTAGADETTPVTPLRQGVQRLSFLEGSWQGTLSIPGRDGAWTAAGSSPLTVAPQMNGLYLVTQVRTGPYLYELVFSFDAAQGRYRVSSRDDQSGLLDIYEGNFQPDGSLVVSNLESGTHYRADTARVHNRMRFTPHLEGGWTWLVEATADGGATWQPQVKSDVDAKLKGGEPQANSK